MKQKPESAVESKSIDQLVTEQNIQPLTDISVLSGVIPDEDLDDFVADIYRERDLAAAAPELRDALEWALEHLANVERESVNAHQYCPNNCMYKKARATLAKAGRAPATGESGVRLSPELQSAYDAGRDAAISGANTTNCHFRLFSSPEKTQAWERGNADAKAGRAPAGPQS